MFRVAHGEFKVLSFYIIHPILKIKNSNLFHRQKEHMLMKAIVVKPDNKRPLLIWQEVSDISFEIDLGWVLGKSLRIIGSRLRSRSLEEKISITRKFRKQFRPLLQEGKMRPVIDRVFPIIEAQAAHEYVRENRNIGKVILEIDVV
jgi:NADPH:quinone reductase-like Zn-dependent oxidoreductase